MNNSSGVSRESIFITIIVGFILILATILYITPLFKKNSQRVEPAKINKESARNIQNIQYIRPDSPLSQDNMSEKGAKYFNEKLYDESYPTFSKQPNTISSGRFSGTITSIDRTNGLVFRITSTMNNSEGVELVYGYPPSALSKITVNKGPIDNLVVGKNMYIDETNDFSKPYPDSIQSVEIHDVQ